MLNVEKTLLSQYANSPIIVGLAQGFNAAIDPRSNIDAFFTQVWNIDSAQGWGLDVWGRIVGISRLIQVPTTEDNFGFKTAAPQSFLPFNEGVFFAGDAATQTYSLSDAAYRSLIFFKAFANIAATTTPALNFLVNKLFGVTHGFYVQRGYAIDGYFAAGDVGRAYVQDLGNMQMRYVFEYDLNEYEFAIINTPGLLPHPSGVKVFVG